MSWTSFAISFEGCKDIYYIRTLKKCRKNKCKICRVRLAQREIVGFVKFGFSVPGLTHQYTRNFFVWDKILHCRGRLAQGETIRHVKILSSSSEGSKHAVHRKFSFKPDKINSQQGLMKLRNVRVISQPWSVGTRNYCHWYKKPLCERVRTWNKLDLWHHRVALWCHIIYYAILHNQHCNLQKQ